MQEPIRIELPTVMENMTVNSWLFKEPEPVLIDCGEKTPGSWDALKKGLKDNGLEIGDIKKLIITHAHLDHVGMAKLICQHSQLEVWVPEYVYDWAVNLKVMLDRREKAMDSVFSQHQKTGYQPFLKMYGYESLSPYWEEIPIDRIRTFKMDAELNFGGAVWQSLYMPGHCINQCCFYQPESQLLLSADMLLKMIPLPIIDAGLEAPYTRVKSLVIQMESYEKLRKLPIQKAFPGHLAPFGKVHDLIDNQVNRIEQKAADCLNAIKSGHQTLKALHPLVYPGRVNPVTFLMMIGLLDILESNGSVEAHPVDGILHYSATANLPA